MKKILHTLFIIFATAGYLIGGFRLTDNLHVRGVIWFSVCLFLVTWISRKYRQYRLTAEVSKFKNKTKHSPIKGDIYTPLNYFAGSRQSIFDCNGNVTGKTGKSILPNIKFMDV
jgi:hypothetical protein